MNWRSHAEAAFARFADPAADRAAYLLRHGSMRAGLYAPVGVDEQTPHDQDELYIIARGRARFVKDGVDVAVEPGDVLFVEAGADHHFYGMEPEFATWVIFWGPYGGEADQR